MNLEECNVKAFGPLCPKVFQLSDGSYVLGYVKDDFQFHKRYLLYFIA